jgi:2-hydroxy-3-keto-5-methylthiopentenyl-1-phosphate phosphatase
MCKRRSLPPERPLAYAGDGVSDRCAARAADRVFARDWLAAEFGRAGLAYEPFETMDDLAAALT